MSAPFRSGFCAIVGKPNVGKSTLLNALVGQKVAIVSNKPQTTRRRVIGVRTMVDTQIVFVDTPGYHTAKTHLGTYMVNSARDESREADVVLFVVDASQPPDENDSAVAEFLRGFTERMVFLTANKIDRLSAEDLPARLEQFRGLGRFPHVFPVSATLGSGLPQMVAALEDQLHEGPAFYPAGQKAEDDDREWTREIIREKALELTRQEVPHSIAVEIEDFKEGQKPGTLYVRATIFVERETHKPIVLGKGGRLIKQIGTRARADMERRLGRPVYLDLWVKVKEDWRDRPDILKTLGYWA